MAWLSFMKLKNKFALAQKWLQISVFQKDLLFTDIMHRKSTTMWFLSFNQSELSKDCKYWGSLYFKHKRLQSFSMDSFSSCSKASNSLFLWMCDNFFSAISLTMSSKLYLLEHLIKFLSIYLHMMYTNK